MVVISVTLAVLMMQTAMAESAVQLGPLVNIGEGDLGLEGSSTTPDGEVSIVHGKDGVIYLVNATSPEKNSMIEWGGVGELVDSDFHPGGQSALMVGESGVALRFSVSESKVEEVADDVFFGRTDLKAVAWNGDGSWAYIGGEEGWIWRIRGLDGGGFEGFPLEGRGSGDVNGLSCMDGSNICVISSSIDGIGVIDEEHDIHWIGGTGYPWIDVVCPSSQSMQCIAISPQSTIAVVSISTSDASKSEIREDDIVQLQGLEGQFNGIEEKASGGSLISMAPFGVIEHQLNQELCCSQWVENSDARTYNLDLSNDRVVSTWSTDLNSGWIVTSTGKFVYFSPSNDENSGGVLGIWVGIVVLGGTTLLAVSLLTSSSPWLSRWMAKTIGSEEEKRRAIKEERRIGRRK
jgi:hypothetical protein